MHSIEPEILHLRDDGVISAPSAARLIAHERREIISIYGELRFLIWGGVMLIATGVGILVSKNLEHIGPIAIATAIGIAAAACYGWAVWKHTRAASLADDYVLLLGSLLLSAEIGYIEHQWHLLGPVWPRHFLLLAVIHAAVAYWFGSRVVLSLSISALAAWFGVERQSPMSLLYRSTDFAVRAYLCAGTLVIWRWADQVRRAQLNSRQVKSGASFSPVFDHAALNLAFWGSLVLMMKPETRLLGCAIAILLASLSAWHGVRRGEERFVIYSWIYGTIAIDVQVGTWLNEEVLIMLFLVVSTAVSIAGLLTAHQKMRGRTE